MQFIYPAFLWALLTLAIPVILHLFYFRRFKKVYFSNVRFLKEVKEETSARSRLRNLFVLLMRLLALLFLVLGFAQPFLPQKGAEKQGIKAVSVYVDNSFSMSALSQDVPLLEKAKQRAREIISAYRAEDKFQVLTNDFTGRQQRLVNREDALALIEEITTSPSVQLLSKVTARQKQALSNAKTDNQIAYLISDFQRSSTDIAKYPDTIPQLDLIPLQAVQEKNIGIDSVWFESPVRMVNQTNLLFLRIHNYSNDLVENARISLKYDGQLKPLGVVSIPPQSEVTDTVNLTILRTGWHQAEVSVTDFPIQFDDSYFFSFNVATEVKVLAINDASPNAYLETAVKGIPYFKMINANSQSLDYSQFGSYQLIVLNDLSNVSSGLSTELQNYVEQGGNLLVFPGKAANLAAYKTFLQGFSANEPQDFETQDRIVGEVNTSEFVFKDVFLNRSSTNLRLPATKGNFRFGRFHSRAEERLLTYRDGNPYLSKYRKGKGDLFICAAPLDQQINNLVNNGEVFVPMLYKMAISSGSDPRIAYTIGRDELLEANHLATSGEIVYKMKGEGEEFIPQQRVVGSKVFLNANNQIRKAGYYDLFLTSDSLLHLFAFNYNRKESALEYFRTNELEEWVGKNVNIITALDSSVLTARIQEKSQGIVLWRWCVILALLFLAVEVLLLRFWRV
jgi:hypothetical protein